MLILDFFLTTTSCGIAVATGRKDLLWLRFGLGCGQKESFSCVIVLVLHRQRTPFAAQNDFVSEQNEAVLYGL